MRIAKVGLKIWRGRLFARFEGRGWVMDVVMGDVADAGLVLSDLQDKSWGINAVLVGFGNCGKHLYPLGAHI
jgi:hypothetical protein